LGCKSKQGITLKLTQRSHSPPEQNNSGTFGVSRKRKGERVQQIVEKHPTREIRRAKRVEEEPREERGEQ